MFPSFLSRVDRTVAVVLAIVWLAAGGVGVAIGLAHESWRLTAVSLFALGFGVAWSLVAWRGRLLGADAGPRRRER